MAFGGINRRQSKRVHLTTDIVLAKEMSSLNPIKGITKDLSTGGACCLIPLQLKVFTIVNLKILVEDETEPLEISGRVTWVREIEDAKNELDREPKEIEENPNIYIIGIQFLTLYSKKKEKLKSIMKSYDNR